MDAKNNISSSLYSVQNLALTCNYYLINLYKKKSPGGIVTSHMYTECSMLKNPGAQKCQKCQKSGNFFLFLFFSFFLFNFIDLILGLAKEKMNEWINKNWKGKREKDLLQLSRHEFWCGWLRSFESKNAGNTWIVICGNTKTETL